MSFSFVSRIIEIEPGRRARGVYVPPPNLAGIPRWLAQKMAYCLRRIDAIEVVGISQRSRLYQRRCRDSRAA